MTLSQLFPKIPQLAKRIQDNKSELMGQYHEFEDYGIDELKTRGLDFYNVQEIKRKFFMKRTSDK
jgi:hypothetical protein